VISSGLGTGFSVLSLLAAYEGFGRPEKKPGKEKEKKEAWKRRIPGGEELRGRGVQNSGRPGG
jgi:hypothetical protein